MSPFIPKVPPEEIQNYVQELGHTTREIVSKNGAPNGFHIEGTSIRVGYNQEYEGRVFGYGMVALWADTNRIDPQVEERSRKLYQKLYRKFHRPKS